MSKVGEEGDIIVLRFKLNICAQDEEMELKTRIMHLEEPDNVGADEWGIYTYGSKFEEHGRLGRVLIQNYVLEQLMSHTI
jgi:hypothetical protein